MNKPVLTVVSLSVLAMACPVVSVIAAPAPGSAQEADRKFLANLESSAAAKATPTQATPTPAHSHSKAKSNTSTRKHGSQLPEVAAANANQSTSSKSANATPAQKTDRDHSSSEDHGFFQRVFGHIFSKHSED
jgi:hypothetical protein